MVEFQEFAQRINERIGNGGSSAAGSNGAGSSFGGASQSAASWKAGGRRAEIELVEPRNIKLTLEGEGGATTWYPIDEALVQLVAKRITGFLAEA